MNEGMNEKERAKNVAFLTKQMPASKTYKSSKMTDVRAADHKNSCYSIMKIIRVTVNKKGGPRTSQGSQDELGEPSRN